MSPTLQPITLYGQGGPNPPKVAFLLSELDIPYTTVPIPFADVKKPAFLAINPNGRLPAIQDPNNGDIILWESGAILEYLIDRYDKDDRKLSFPPGSPESYHAKQWLFFQTTGQGPYYGQSVWFHKFHPEKLPSAIERYNKEVNRVTRVLEAWLAKQKQEYGDKLGDGPWLVGNKMSYADLAFVTWQKIVEMFEKDEYDVDQYPNVKEWLGKMTERKKVKEVLEVAFAGH